MIENHLKTFVDVTLNFFNKATGDGAEVGEPFIQFGDPKLLGYTGVVSISGILSGAVYITAEEDMLNKILHHMSGVDDAGKEEYDDLVGEMASVLSSNARKDFGENFNVSLPEVFHSGNGKSPEVPGATFALPICWKGHESFLVIGVQEEVKS